MAPTQLVLEQTINNIVATRGRVSKHEDGELLLLLGCINGSEGVIESLNILVLPVTGVEPKQAVLKLNEVRRKVVGVYGRVVLLYPFLDELTFGLVASDGCAAEIGAEDLWELDLHPDAALTDSRQRGGLARESIVLLVSLLVLLLLLSSIKHLVKVRVLDHEVESFTADTLELDGSRRLVAVKEGPLSAELLVGLEHGSVQLDECFRDDRLVLAFSALDTHHRR